MSALVCPCQKNFFSGQSTQTNTVTGNALNRRMLFAISSIVIGSAFQQCSCNISGVCEWAFKTNYTECLAFLVSALQILKAKIGY